VAASVFIDGVDVTASCTMPQEQGGGVPIEWHRRGGRPSTLTLRGPSSLLGGTLGVSEGVMTGLGAGFTGTLWRRDDEGNQDDCWSTLLFADQSAYFPKRLVKDGEDSEDPLTGEPDPGNFSDPSIIQDYLYGPSIFAAALENSITLDGDFGPVGLGSISVTLGDTVDLTGFKPTDWPMTIDDLRSLLSNGGVLAYKMVGTNIQLFEGPLIAGTTVSQAFEYGTGSFNCTGARRSLEMENVFNVVWDLLGPKEPLYDNDIQHWRGNVTIDDTGTQLINGVPTYVGIPDPPFSEVEALVLASRATYGRLQRVDEYDLYKDERTPFEKRPLRRIAQMLWLQKSRYCANPRQLVTMIPEPGIEPLFDVYDTIPVAAGAMLNGGFSGEQRVYEFKVSVDTEGNAQLTELVTSPNLG
jgi:hypothetical protein